MRRNSLMTLDKCDLPGSKQCKLIRYCGRNEIIAQKRRRMEFLLNTDFRSFPLKALTSPDQTMLLQVLQNIPIVPLFAQNIRQEILLSLLHQLSCGNLQEQFEMKIS